MRVITVAIALGLLLAGCVDQKDPEPAPEPAPDKQFDDPDRNLTVDQPDALPRTPPAPGERDLTAPPVWRLGEWWKVRVTDFFEDRSEDVIRVVAGSEGHNYLVGFPIESFSNYAMVLHHPAYGDIRKSDLAYDTHDQPFKHLDFPFKVGTKWDTRWQQPNATRHMEVVEVDHANGTARINITQTVTNAIGQTSEQPFGYIIYDAELGSERLMVFNNYAKVEVIEHGYNYTGAVRVPHAHDLVFFHGRVGPVTPIGWSTGGPAADMDETITIDPFYDRVSFAIIIVDVPGFVAQSGTNSGYYEQTATAPQGNTYTLSLAPDEQKDVKIAFFEHERPEGEWQLSTLAGGPGQVLFEGIGYHSIDIELPSGCVLPSANALHHVTLCKA